MDEGNIKEENGTNSKPGIRLDIKDEFWPLWEGEVRLKTEEGSEEIKAPVQIFHKDDAKNGSKLFDWVPYGKTIS